MQLSKPQSRFNPTFNRTEMKMLMKAITDHLNTLDLVSNEEARAIYGEYRALRAYLQTVLIDAS